MNSTLPPTLLPIRRTLRSVLPVLAVVLLTLAPVPASARPRPVEPVLPAATANIDTADRAAVASAYRTVYLPASAVRAPDPTGEDVQACAAGSTPDDLQSAMLQLVNYFRGMTQVPAVTFDPDLSFEAQQAALMVFAGGSTDHNPSPDSTCYSSAGANGAAHSNLALGYAGADVVAGYMADGGEANTGAGHRLGLQRAAARLMGNGTFGTANALWLSSTPSDVPTTTPAFTSWPSAGYFPAPLEPAGRWSFTPTDPTADLSAATVSVTTSGGAVLPSMVNPGGDVSSLVFEVGHLTAPTGSAVTSYDVTVSGVQVGGQPVEPYHYSVKMIDPSSRVPPVPSLGPETRAAVRGEAVVGSTLTAVAPRWNQSGVKTTYQWLRDKKLIKKATKATYRPATADIGHRLSVRATGRTASEHAASTSSQTVKVTKVRSTLSVTPSSPAVGRVRLVVRLTARGLGPTSVVKIRDGKKTVARALKVKYGHAAYQAKAKPGRHHYTVTYAGTARLTSATSTVAVTVRDKVAAHLRVSGKSATPKKVTFRVTVKADGQASLGGSVKISRGSKTLVKKLVIHHGSASYTAKKQPKGKQKYTVTYGGTSSVRRATLKLTVKVRAPISLVSYASCDAMDSDYPHGVGRSDASDSTSGTPVTDFFPSNALYAANDGGSGEHDLDRDNDGIACER